MKWIFTNILYPILIISIFASIFCLSIILLKRTKDTFSRIKHFTAVFLPYVLLVFLIDALETQDANHIKSYIASIQEIFKFIMGVLIGIGTVEIGLRQLNSKSDTGTSGYLLFLSGVGASVLYLIMKGASGNLQLFFLGFVLAGSLLIIFRKPFAPTNNVISTKLFVILYLLIFLGIFFIFTFSSDWILKPVYKKPQEIQESLNLLERAIDEDRGSFDQQNVWDAITKLKEMDASHKISPKIMMKILLISYTKSGKEQIYKDISIEVIDYFTKLQINDLCELLRTIESENKDLSSYAKDARLKICNPRMETKLKKEISTEREGRQEKSSFKTKSKGRKKTLAKVGKTILKTPETYEVSDKLRKDKSRKKPSPKVIKIVGYGYDYSDGTIGNWDSQYPEPSLNDYEGRSGESNAKWKGSYTIKDNNKLCLKIENLEAPYPPLNSIGIGYTVTLLNAFFEDGSEHKSFILYKFSGTPREKSIVKCYKIIWAK